jgi:hypothetical protein
MRDRFTQFRQQGPEGTGRSDPTGYRAPSGYPSARPNWREQVTTASFLNLLAGVWLIIAPWVLGYSGEDPRWNDVVFGAIVAFFALARTSGAYRASSLSWLNALIGVWVFIAAFTIDFSSTAQANDIILGALIFIFGIWSASASESRPSRRQPVGGPDGRRYRGGSPLPH